MFDARRKYLLLRCVAGLVTFACAPAAAQTDITRMSIEDLANTEVFTASRFVQKTIDAPASITVVTADEIRRFGYRTLADVIANARDFYTSDDRNYVYVGVRGFSRPGDYNGRLLLLIDGHRINDPLYDQAGFDRTLPLDVDLIDRVEIVRGATSSLYGTNAMMAVVNVITKKMSAVDGVQVATEAGALGAYGGRVTFGRQWKHGIGLLASVSAANSNGEQRIFFPEYNTPADNFGVASGLDGERTRSAYLRIEGRGLALRGAYGRRFKLVPTATFGSLFNYRESTVDAVGYVEIAADRGFEKWDLHAHASYDTYYYDGVYPLEPRASEFDFARTRWWTGDAMLSPHLGRRQKLQLGGELRVATRRAQYASTNDVGFGCLSDPRVWGLFIQDELTVIPRLKIVAGVRYDDLGSAQTRASPRLALVFKPLPSTALKLLGSTAFRAPNAFEQGYWGIQPLLPKLHPEKIEALELIAEQYTRNGLRLSLSMYRNRMDDLISQTSDATGNLGYVNGGNVITHGLSFEIEKRFQSDWQFRGSWSLQRSIDPGTQLVMSNSPTHLAKFGLIVPLFRGRVHLGITDRAGSGVLNVRRLPVPAQNQTDLTLSSGKLWRKTELSASLYNLWNARILVPGAEEHLQESLPQYGRTWRIKVTHTF